MVDIHSHVLWEMDDGASSLKESIEMLETAAGTGTTDLVATPHWNPQYEFQAERTAERIRQLTTGTGGKVRLHRGCEIHLTWDNLERLLATPGLYTINGHQYLLVELPHLQVGKHVDAVLDHLLNAGLSPVVAHPERNPVLRQKLELVESWVERGCFMQLTALSITGGFGAAAKRASRQMLDRGFVHVVASDAHDPVRRHPRLNDAYQLVRSEYGEACAEALFTGNPRDIVEGVHLAGGRQNLATPAGPWWRFWRKSSEPG